MMKLTNGMREEFVDDVMASVKWKSKWDKNKIVVEISNRLNAKVPADIKAFDVKHPNMLVRESISLDFMRRHMKSEKHQWLEYASATCIKGVSLNDISVSDLMAEWTKYLAECEARAEMRSRLTQIAKEMNTDEQLAAALPKLVRFIPKPVVKIKAGLPVAMKGIQDELVKLGLEVTK